MIGLGEPPFPLHRLDACATRAWCLMHGCRRVSMRPLGLTSNDDCFQIVPPIGDGGTYNATRAELDQRARELLDRNVSRQVRRRQARKGLA